MLSDLPESVELELVLLAHHPEVSAVVIEECLPEVTLDHLLVVLHPAGPLLVVDVFDLALHTLVSELQVEPEPVGGVLLLGLVQGGQQFVYEPTVPLATHL